MLYCRLDDSEFAKFIETGPNALKVYIQLKFLWQKFGQKPFTHSLRQISKELKISVKTVEKSIYQLLILRLIDIDNKVVLLDQGRYITLFKRVHTCVVKNTTQVDADKIRTPA